MTETRTLAIDEGAQLTEARSEPAGAARSTPEPSPAFLDPHRWTRRHTTLAALAAAAILVSWMVEAVQSYPATADGLRAAFGAAVAVAIAALALSLRGVTVPGLVIGGFVVLAGIVTWTWTDTPVVPWTLFAVEGLILAVWTFPWFRDALRLPRLGAAWLGIAYWPLGILSAVLTATWTIGAQRVAFCGLAVLTGIAAIVAVRRTGKDPTIGVVAAFLLATAALVLVGSGNVFDDVHAVPENAWGARMQFRFWGGPGLLYHPNSLAVVAVIAALRIAPDRSFLRWQRAASLGVLGLIIVLTNSRTALLFLGVAAVVHALVLLRQQLRLRRGRPVGDDGLSVYGSFRRAAVVAVVPFLLLGVVFVGSGGTNFLVQSRYQNRVPSSAPTTPADASSSDGDLDLTSGRVQTWQKVFDDFSDDTVVEKALGNNDHARGAVIREETGRPEDRPKLSTDNSLVGALRRAGVLGVAAFLGGLALLLYHALRRGAPAWLMITAVASLSTMATSDWLLGGSGGTLWVFLLAAEAWVVYGLARDRAPTPAPTPKPASANAPS